MPCSTTSRQNATASQQPIGKKGGPRRNPVLPPAHDEDAPLGQAAGVLSGHAAVRGVLCLGHHKCFWPLGRYRRLVDCALLERTRGSDEATAYSDAMLGWQQSLGWQP